MLNESRSPPERALTSLFAAANLQVWSEKEIYGGAYLVPFGMVKRLSENAMDAGFAEELWVTSEKVVKDVLRM
jgi:hypothetical protein